MKIAFLKSGLLASAVFIFMLTVTFNCCKKDSAGFNEAYMESIAINSSPAVAGPYAFAHTPN
jgi:hypothetical protein